MRSLYVSCVFRLILMWLIAWETQHNLPVYLIVWCQYLSASCLLIKFATPYIAGVPALFLVGVPTISSFICGSPHHIHFFFSCGSPRHSSLFLAGVPAVLFFFFSGSPRPFFSFSCGSPRLISFSIAGVPATYKFQLRESPPHINFNCGSPRPFGVALISISSISSKFDKQRWREQLVFHRYSSFHISSQLHLIIISIQSHHNHSSQFAPKHGDNSTTSIHFSIQIAHPHLFLNKNTKHNLNNTSQQHVSQHSINHTFHHNKHITQQEYKAQVP